MTIKWSEHIREKLLEMVTDGIRHEKIKNGFVGPMNKHSAFMGVDTRGKTVDLHRGEWSRVYNTYEGSGQ